MRKKACGWLRIGLAWLWAWTLGVGMAAPEADLIVQRAVFFDPTGQLDIDAVTQQTFRPVEGPVSRGFTPGTLWLRLEVRAADRPNRVLMVQPTYLDDVRLYSPRADRSGWAVRQQGDRFAFADRGRSEVLFAFSLEPAPEAVSTHYLRVRSTSALLVHARVLAPPDNVALDSMLHVAFGLYGGLILAMLVFAFAVWRVTRDPLWGLDGLFQLASLSYGALAMGFVTQYLLPHQPALADTLTSAFAIVHMGTASLFFWRFIVAYRTPRWTLVVYLVPLLFSPVGLAMLLLGHTQAAVSINSMLVLYQTLGGAVVGTLLKFDDRLLRWLVRGMYIGLVAYVTYFILPVLGLARMTTFHLYPALLANLFSGVMLQAILARRTQLQLREKRRLEDRVREMDQQLRHEIERHRATSSFLGMIMHELKTPLAAIRLATQSLISGRAARENDRATRLTNIQKSVDGIDAVLERCVEVDRLEQGGLRIDPQPQDLVALVADWISTEPQQARLRLRAPDRLDVTLDAPLVCLMLRNLVHNALNYSPPKSPVDVIVSRAVDEAGNHSVSVEVRNELGRAGAPDPQRLFEKYYRADTAKHLTGTGLGLYWVRRVAEMLEGGIRYRVEESQIVFTLWLPN